MTPLAKRLALRAAERPLTFAEFMTAALYDPDHGYYARGPSIGAEGDFYTSASLPGFASSLARGLADLAARMHATRPTIVELGAGAGDLAVALSAALPDARYACVEPSGGLREKQRARGLESVADLAEVGELEGGIVLANEVLDALPVHRVRCAGNSGSALEELYVRYRPGFGFSEEAGPLSTPALADALADATLAEAQIVEVSLLFGPLLRALARTLREGYVVLVDYGDERPAIHAEERARGTLRAFHRHALEEDFFARVGEQDLTASVDFTAVKREALDAGFQVAGYATQGEALLSLGVMDDHARLAAEDPFAALKAKTLFVPGGMGDAFKVLVLARNAPTEGLRFFAPPRAAEGFWL